MKRLVFVPGIVLLFALLASFLLSLPSSSHAQGSDTETPTATPTESQTPTQTPTQTLGSCGGAPEDTELLSPAHKAKLIDPIVVLKWNKVDCKPKYTLVVRHGGRKGIIVVEKTFKKKAFIATLERGRKYFWTVTTCLEENCTPSESRKFSIMDPTPTPTMTATRTRTPTRFQTNTPKPPTSSPPTNTPAGNCSPAYPDFCIPPPPPDLDCADIGTNNFTVLPPDPHGLDGDNDGVGCES